jgi:hypothetical protein
MGAHSVRPARPLWQRRLSAAAAIVVIIAEAFIGLVLLATFITIIAAA